MGICSSISRKAFITSAGKRIFCVNGFGAWGKALIIPDAETEELIYKKELWFHWIHAPFFLTFICLFMYQISPHISFNTQNADIFAGFLITMELLRWIFRRIVFRHELRDLEKTKNRLLIRFYWRLAAKQINKTEAYLKLLAFVFLLLFIIGLGVYTDFFEMNWFFFGLFLFVAGWNVAKYTYIMHTLNQK